MSSFVHRLVLWENVEVAGIEAWRVGRVLKHSDFLLAKICFTDNALWAGALCWCKIHPFLYNTDCYLVTRSRDFVKTSM